MSTATSQQTPAPHSSSSSSTSSPSNSISLVRLDELSSFGATKQSRLPALIRLNTLAESQQQQQQQATSMPDFSASQVEKVAAAPPNQQAESLPADLHGGAANKENTIRLETQAKSLQDGSHDFQVVDMDDDDDEHRAAELMGPSLPAPKGSPLATGDKQQASLSASLLENMDAKSLSAQLQSTNLTGQYASHLGDSLIEMIINLRNENQNLIRALETNNEYVKERLSEFKKCQEEAKRRETQYAMEKAEFEHQARKLQRQNGVLSERLKSLEAKLREMNVEVNESLIAAHSSKASSIRGEEAATAAATAVGQLYPQLADASDESFSNAALNNAVTMQMDATSGELYNQGDQQESSLRDSQMGATTNESKRKASTSAGGEALQVGQMSREELSKRFDADKAQFYALDDPMKQCDQLERQLNDIGRRDYEICLLQQQLNIYRQDFRLERMAKLEAKIQIEKLKADIDRLCLERLQEQRSESDAAGGVRFGPTTMIPNAGGGSGEGNLIGKLGHHLGKKAVRSAAKAAKYAAKQAHLEEKAAAALARAAAAKAAATSHFTMPKATTADQQHQPMAEGLNDPLGAMSQHHQHHHHRGHQRHSSHGQSHHHHRGGGGGRGGIRSEVMNDLLSTANKAMLTGYKMASTHVNLALDKLSQYEQQQASQLDPNNKPPIQQTQADKSASSSGPSAPPMEPHSID